MAKGKATDAPTEGAIAIWTQRARGVGLLVGFAITFLVSRNEGLPMADSALRGVLGAFAMSVICWWCALMVIQGLMRTAIARQNAEAEEAVRQIAEARAAQAAAEEGRPPGAAPTDPAP